MLEDIHNVAALFTRGIESTGAYFISLSWLVFKLYFVVEFAAVTKKGILSDFNIYKIGNRVYVLHRTCLSLFS
jgi:hypothetical protein